MRGTAMTLAALLLTAAFAARAEDETRPPVRADAQAPGGRGAGIQRTMALLASSTPTRRNTVRILFYGQSITEQDWWRSVADDLRRRFPNADLVIENRALGGFSSQRLVKTAETDLYPFYPDLLIFHVYGAHPQYADIIRRTRARTTAEVLIQNDHVTKADAFTEETDPAKLRPDGAIWPAFMNHLWLPQVARENGCALLDQRGAWKAYLRDNSLEPAALLRDGVHLNDRGCALMAEIVQAYLVPREDAPADPFNSPTVRTLLPGRDGSRVGDMLKFTVEGNRIDVIPTPGAPEVSVRIDGKHPSEFPELYGFTRALPDPGGKWPVILKIGGTAPKVLEAWTLEAKAAPEGHYRFSLSGSVTGPDGEGRSDERFVSESGRIVIEPDDWDVEYAMGLAGRKPPPETFRVTWKVVPHFADTVAAPAEPAPGVEPAVTVARGLRNGTHTVELRSLSPTAVRAIRVYRPPVAE